MTDEKKPKRKMSENSLKNLIPFSMKTEKDKERQKRICMQGVEAQRKARAQKIKREDAKTVIWETFFGTEEKLIEFFKTLSPKDQKDILEKILPPDIQENKITGDIQTKTVYKTEADVQETLKNILKVVNEQ